MKKITSARLMPADWQFLDAEMLAVHLAPTGSMFAFLAAHRGDVFPDADYTDLFAPPGRAAVAATRRWRR
jgi:hypothetical protein